MGTTRILALTFAFLIALVVAGPEAAYTQEAPGSSGEAPDQTMAAADDDTQLAAQFREWAKRARENAERHRTMAARYATRTKPIMRTQMKEHCANIVSLEEKLAAEYDGLAAIYEPEANE